MAGVPYYPLVKPEVPVADHTAAKIVASSDLAGSFLKGLSVFAHINAEKEKLATDTALELKKFEIQRENNLMDFEVGMTGAKALSDYRKTMSQINSDPSNPAGLAGRINIAREKAETYADFNKRANDYGLLDPNPKNPVEFYANYQKLNDEFAFADDMPEIRNGLTTIKARTERHTVPIKYGRTFNEDENEWQGGSETKNVPVGQIVENLNDPSKANETVALLEQNGLTVSKPEKKPLPDSRSWFDNWIRGKKALEQTVTTETLGPSLRPFVKMGMGVDFSRGKPRTPVSGVVVPNATTSTVAPSVIQSDVDQADAALATEAGTSVSTPPPVMEPTGQPKIGMGGYEPGRRYSGKLYLGGNPNDPANWQ